MKIINKYPILLHLKSVVVSPWGYIRSWYNFFAHGTQAKRWSDMQNFHAEWDERLATIATMIAPNSSVLEFASGREQLEKLLPEGCTYQPSDIVARSDKTIVCDLNAGFPSLPQQQYDVVVLSGLMEYIHDPQNLLKNVRKHCKECIVSYVPTENLECMSTRINQGWVNHISEAAFLDIIQKMSFTVIEQKTWRNQIIYRLQ